SFLVLGFFLAFGGPVSFQTQPISSLFEFSLGGDALAGFFVVIISIVTLAVSVYTIGSPCDPACAGTAAFFYPILILSLYAVVLSANLFTFLLAWETMAIASYF